MSWKNPSCTCRKQEARSISTWKTLDSLIQPWNIDQWLLKMQTSSNHRFQQGTWLALKLWPWRTLAALSTALLRRLCAISVKWRQWCADDVQIMERSEMESDRMCLNLVPVWENMKTNEVCWFIVIPDQAWIGTGCPLTHLYTAHWTEPKGCEGSQSPN